MQTYDLLMVAILAGTALWGFWKGMAWQVASLASLVVSYIVALNFSDLLAPYISAEAPWNRYAAMLILYVATAGGIWLAFGFVSSTIERIRLKEFDRQVGGLFGAAKGVVLCLVVTFFAVTLSESTRTKVLASKSGKYIADLIHEAKPIIPHELHDTIGPYLDRLNNGLDPNQAPAEQGGFPIPPFNADRTTTGGGWGDGAAGWPTPNSPAGNWPSTNQIDGYREAFDAAQRMWNQNGNVPAAPASGGFPANR